MGQEEVCNCDGISMATLHDGIYLWHPAPAGSLVALEQIQKAQQVKRVSSIHIFVCPKLLEPEWRGQVYKSADMFTEILVGQEYWPHCMHEPLILAIYLSYLTYRPWELRKTPAFMEVGKTLLFS